MSIAKFYQRRRNLLLLMPLLLMCVFVFGRSSVSSASPTEFKVFEIVFDPVIEAQSNMRLTQLKGWYEPSTLDAQYIADIRTVSHDYIQYSIQRVIVDDIPQKKDGFRYSDSSYLQCLQNTTLCHMPDTVDYGKIFRDYDICSKVVDQGVSEIWLWGGPYFGYWEYNIKGPKLNISPENMPQCGNKTIFIMGFSYERGIAEMVHNFGHRSEGVMIDTIAHGNWQQNEDNDWNKFSLVASPISTFAYGHCGNVHYPPNGLSDYDYSNTRMVSSDCDDWMNYPNLNGSYAMINCQAWGCSGYGYYKWWLYRLPHASGTKNGYLNDWWRYVVDYDNATTSPTATPTATTTPSATSTATPTATTTPIAPPTATPTATTTPSATPTIIPPTPAQRHIYLPLPWILTLR